MKKDLWNLNNEKLKNRYFEMLENAKGRDPKTINSYANAIHEFEIFTEFDDFKKFHIKQAVNFKKYFMKKKNKRTGEVISKSYLCHCMVHVREFFEWLSKQSGYSVIKHDDVQYFNITRNDRNKALATSYQESCAIEDIICMIRNMKDDSE